MLTLQPILEHNFLDALALRIREEQQGFVASATGILARAYAYRRSRSRCRGIYAETRMVGLALVCDLDGEPACYHLMELLISKESQGRGYGSAAVKLLLDECRREGKYRTVEVCVKAENSVALHVYEKAGFRNLGAVDPETPDCCILSFQLPETRGLDVEIHGTGEEDLENVQRLWANPEVMRYVGFPNGLFRTLEELRSDWLPWVQDSPARRHYSVYERELGYCGESFYSVDETGLACMDIKLLPHAVGKGIAYQALNYALGEAFRSGGAKRAYVDPHPENARALALYARLGFLPARRPEHLEPWDTTYFELTRENWEALHGNPVW